MEPHRESTGGSNTSPASTLLSSYSQVFLVFFLQVQIPCYILSSCATSLVRRAVSLSVVPVQHCCLEEDPPRPSISFPWAVLCVVDFLSLIQVGHSTGKTHETMKQRQVRHTSTSNDFHAALFVDEHPRPSIDVCTIAYRVGLRAKANCSAPTFEPAHEARAWQRAALSFQLSQLQLRCSTSISGPQASSLRSELSVVRTAENVISFCPQQIEIFQVNAWLATFKARNTNLELLDDDGKKKKKKEKQLDRPAEGFHVRLRRSFSDLLILGRCRSLSKICHVRFL